MPIPNFDLIENILPPHLGDPTKNDRVAPYRCSLIEILERFPINRERAKIIQGFLALRERMLDAKLLGVQWIGGSFVENIEAQGRYPNDIDVVTFVCTKHSSKELDFHLSKVFPDLLDTTAVRNQFMTDHYLIPLSKEPLRLIYETKYWYGLLSHKKWSGKWKGTLEIQLLDDSEHRSVRDLLRSFT